MHNNTETRESKRLAWLKKIFNDQSVSLTPVSGDASFRQYYRVKNFSNHYILMDAPPEKENCKIFADIAKVLETSAIPVPKIHHADYRDGFLLLEDFGDNLFSDVVHENPDEYYKLAMDNLVPIQIVNTTYELPKYDINFIKMEAERFEEWFLAKFLNLQLTSQDQATLVSLYHLFETVAEEQPQVFVHRDYHSRNLLIPENKPLGIIDFQDAIRGPVTYDLASLLKDCYIQWPRRKVLSWLSYYFNRATKYQLIPATIKISEFVRWFDLIGLQRHLKVLGIFARLSIRDNKPQYLNDIPRVLAYIEEVIHIYSELNSFIPIFDLFNQEFKGTKYA